jgi:hypothetical protein
MTREQVLAMQPGRELDMLVAESVMGWVVDGSHLKMNGYIAYMADFKPSRDISAAWEVEEKIKTMDIEVVRRYVSLIYDLSGYGFVAIHASPAARSKAALLAVMGK